MSGKCGRASRWYYGAALMLLLCTPAAALECGVTPIAQWSGGETPAVLFPGLNVPVVAGQRVALQHSESLCEFYVQRQGLPAWNGGMGTVAPSEALVGALIDSGEHGLDPLNPRYHLAEIVLILGTTTARYLPDMTLERLLGDAFMTLGYDLHRGVAFGLDINDTHHKVAPKELPMARLLGEALRSETIPETLEGLAPKTAAYRRLKEALAEFNRCACMGGWVSDERFYKDPERVRERLEVSGEYARLEGEAPDSEEAQRRYLESVKAFQSRHGLQVDGIVGPMTRRALAEPVEKKLERIRLNMERWRWFSAEAFDDYVLVNIPDFSLELVEGRERRLEMAVIIGREVRKTPTMDATMSYLVLNPYWRVPKTILNEDIAPKAAADVGYFARKRISIFRADDRNEVNPVDPATIDWAHWNRDDAGRYVLRQEPGPQNALGYVKFIFPNEEDIYIHDTPHTEYFANDKKMFSSGCIRAEKPIELAKLLMERERPNMTYRALFTMLGSGKRQVIRLEHPIHVYLTYQTAWVDAEGRFQFRPDVYGYDADLTALIGELLP